MSHAEPYNGWLIELVRGQAGYSFRCQHPGQNFVVSDERTYLTYEQALKAARLRADLESVQLALRHFINGRLQLLLLSPAERVALENSLAQCVNAVSDPTYQGYYYG
ncbi:MAG: hypothetical protein ICV77_09685 [Cyanobacteria bacterium Co-bin8]|nr:hypothetical protein [Cyanobacteria bacterium Co-bin8]